MPCHCAVCGSSLKVGEVCVCSQCLLALQHPCMADISDNEVLRRVWAEQPICTAITLFYYQRSSDSHLLLQDMKYKGRTDLCRYMGQMLAETFLDTDFFQSLDLIVPVPLSVERKQWRGYNQSDYIALGISQIARVPVLRDLLVRHVDNETQTHKSVADRKENVKGIFRVNEKACLASDDSVPDGLHILVVDDVVTTGATLNSAIQTLSEAFPHALFSVASVALTRN